ncbi:3-oxoacyl-[acyl-carrier-protein] reductase [bacterium]|jgi:3-oxoacyl-[acyl-carrier protein] reductase|nr:3-oxoacyl-[acyl-carrier-protein] reductase [bacterium]
MTTDTNKTAIVTGSTRGIGLSIANGLAKDGYNIVVCGRSQETCDSSAKEISTKYGVKTLGIAVNVSKQSEVSDLVKQAISEFGSIEVLINNAGITKDNLVLRMSEDDWESVIQVNLNSIFYFTKAVIRSMMKKRFGRIVNITSVVGVMGNPGQSNYAASKAGMIGFTKSIAKEYGSKGITCNAVAPGFIDTDMIESLPKDYIDNIISQIPVKRLGEPTEVSNVVSFLTSDKSSYITGQVINVDGGVLM